MCDPSPAPRTLVNGLSDSCVGVNDRGFTLGDGLFETLAIRSGRIQLWEAHMARLCQDAARLYLPLPDADQLRAESETLIEEDENGSLRITWTRGPAGRGYRLPANPTPTRVISFHPGPPQPRSPAPLQVRVTQVTLAEQPVLAGIKHLNRLEQILARAEVDRQGIDEGLMCNASGEVIEATMSNLFLVHEGGLHTPELTRCGVRGIMRHMVLQTAESLGIKTRIRAITQAEVMAADEIFLTNSIRGIQPVGSVDQQSFVAPGPLTARLTDILEAYW